MARQLLGLDRILSRFTSIHRPLFGRDKAATTRVPIYAAECEPVYDGNVRPTADPPRAQDSGSSQIAWTALMVGPPRGALGKSAFWLAGRGIRLVWQTTLCDARKLLAMPNRFSHLFVDLDSQGGIERFIDELSAFRSAFPGMPTVLVSSEFMVDDFDLHRIWLCDASLRPTASHATLELSLTASIENNKAWRTRKGRALPPRSGRGP